ncbi:MAG: hypothetical protein ABSE06_12300 [Anaerolineaceae bacterium]
MNVYHGRNKTGRLKKWRTVKDKGSWALEKLEGVNVSDAENSILVEPVYRRIFSIESNGLIIIESGNMVIGISTRFPFIVVMRGDPDFLEEK